MIRLGLRLTLAGGREAITRLALIAIAVAVGTGLLLTTLASVNAVNTQNARYAWLETGYTGSNAPGSATPVAGSAAHDPLWWRLRADYYQGKQIGRVDLAATGPQSPIPPGITTLPAPGQYYASPSLAKLLHATPPAQLGDRYPGTLIGTISSAALPAPDSLIIVIGHSVAELSHQNDVRHVNQISTTVPSSCSGDCAFGVGTNNNGITLILSVVAAALLFPVLIFIGGATRLSAARREQRFAAMRLVGATPGQISVLSTVESGVAASLGVAAGFGLFFALRPAIATIPFTGDPFFTSDLSLSLVDVLLVALGIPMAAALAARLALRRVTISPLGVTRRVTPRQPRAWRLIPLLAGVAELGYFAYVHDIGATSRTNTTVEAAVFLVGVLLIMAGLVIAGPWLTMVASRLTARRANRPATLIAARRLADNPQAGFRAISGLVLAVFVGTCAVGIITTIASGSTTNTAKASSATLVDDFKDVQSSNALRSIPAETTHKITSIPGVTGLAVIHSRFNPNPPPIPELNGARPDSARHVRFDPIQDFVTCEQLAGVPALGHCPHGASVVAINPDYGGGLIDRSSMADTTWPAADMTVKQLSGVPIGTLVVGTGGSSAAVEQARTVLDLAYPDTFAAQSINEIHADNNRLLDGYRQLANVVILTSLPIAGCSLAVSIAGGLAERKRPFSLLRLTGAPLAMLRRVITLEAAAPLLITALVSIGAGFLAADLFLRAQLHEGIQAPGLQYYLMIAAGLIASIAVIASTLPLLNRLTGPEVARNE
ncbi:MAG: hypothetical protein JWN96_4603 [Mycobacterium sp.]|nr:hypothetical protein [Mycobacterium sp.]